MAPILYAHPFSSYCQKVLIALYENNAIFTMRVLNDEQSFAQLAALWPHKKFPVLATQNATVIEASVIIEYLRHNQPGPVDLLSDDPQAALQIRFMDRFFDNYVMTPMQKVVADSLRPADGRDPLGVADAKTQLECSYQWLESTMQNRTWAAGDVFSMADCAAAPSLFYADWVHEIDQKYLNLRAYRARLLARPSVVRVVNEARPYRHLFPLGAPDRD